MSDRHAPSSAPTHDDVLRLRPDAPPPAPRALPPSRPRIEEVARLAGVSPITVSRALRQPEGRQDKRERILQVVAQTGYASNPHARALRSGQSSVVAAFVSNIFSQQFALAVQGCAEVLEPQGYQLMVGQTSYSYAKETSMIASLRAAAGGRAVHRRHRAGREPAVAARTRHSHHGNLGLSARSHRHAGRTVQLRRRLHGGQPSGRARLPARGLHGPPRRPRRIAPPGLRGRGRASRAGGRRRTGRGQSADHRRWPGRAGPAAV